MIRVTLHMHPGASRDRVARREDNTLDVWVRARPVEGKANQAALALLAETLGLRRSEVILVRGERGRTKVIELSLASTAELDQLLARAE